MSLDARSKTEPEDSPSDGRKSSSSRSRSSGGRSGGGGGPRAAGGQAGGGGASVATTTAAAEEAEQQVVPVFFLTIGVCKTSVTFTPDVSAFDGALASILARLNEVVASTAPLMQDRAFSPFSQPILYGKIESYRTPPDEETLVTPDHSARCQKRMAALCGSVAKAFQLCGEEMGPYTKTAFEFCNRRTPEDGEADSKVETDVEVLKATLARLQEQQAAIKSIPESRSISFFKADLRLFKRTVLPNITRAITKLQESLPKVGREKMDDFGEDAKTLKDLIEFEPKVPYRDRLNTVRNMYVILFVYHHFISLTSGRR